MIQNNVLKITTVKGRLAESSVRGELSDHYVKADLKIDRTPAHVDMHSENITCEVDYTDSFASEGDKTVAMLTADFAESGIENAQNAAHNTAVEGQLLVHAAKGEDVFKEVAGEFTSGNIPNTGIKFIPSVRPTITWHKNSLEMEGHPEKDVYNWTTSTRADISMIKKGGVTVSVAQEPEINIEYTGDPNTLHLLDVRA